MGNRNLDTGTAADLLTLEDSWDPHDHDRLTRVATSNQEWIVKDWDGEMYYVRFDKNFSKKHLFTFSKKKDKVQQEAYLLHKGGEQEHTAWEKAEHEMLHRKIDKVLANRSVSGICQCGHAFNRHPPNGTGACNVHGCGCPSFQTPYAQNRATANKPTHNPLAGMSTNRNTCIILNYVPKSEFESIVVHSLQAVEKPTGWARGQPLANAIGDEVVLKWDFGLARKGVILQATHGTAHNAWTKLQGCHIKAKKIASAVGRQTWEIFHMETTGAHAPF